MKELIQIVFVIPATMNRLIPLPIPQPFCTNSSSIMRTNPAMKSCPKIMTAVLKVNLPY